MTTEELFEYYGIPVTILTDKNIECLGRNEDDIRLVEFSTVIPLGCELEPEKTKEAERTKAKKLVISAIKGKYGCCSHSDKGRNYDHFTFALLDPSVVILSFEERNIVLSALDVYKHGECFFDEEMEAKVIAIENRMIDVDMWRHQGKGETE